MTDSWTPPFRVQLQHRTAEYLVLDSQNHLVLAVNTIRLGVGTDRFTMAEDVARELNQNLEFPYCCVPEDDD